jgi:hypothetical protein
MLRSLIALSLFMAATSLLVPTAAYAPMAFVQYPLVHRVNCDEGSGSAFRVGANHWLTALHVAALTHCEIDGAPVTVTERDEANDFARMDTPLGVPNGYRINCSGFVPGRWYWASGFANGAPFQTGIAVYATYARDASGKRVLIGPNDFIPGMSGGPVMDESGAVVGMVNAYVQGTPISLSREMRDTSMCGASIA